LYALKPSIGLNIDHHQKTVLDLAVQKGMTFFYGSSDGYDRKKVISHAMKQNDEDCSG
jgi:hypothetical protein